jgi:hypothetical protein
VVVALGSEIAPKAALAASQAIPIVMIAVNSIRLPADL